MPRSSSRLPRAAALVLALACERGAPRPDAAPAPPPTAAQREAGAPGERAPAPPESGRADRHRRAASRAGAVRRIAGTLAHRSPERVVIRAPGEETLTLGVGSATAITLDGKPARLEALREGTAVRATYESGRAGRATAISIEGRSGTPGGASPTGAAAPAPVPPPEARWAPNLGPRGSEGGG